MKRKLRRFTQPNVAFFFPALILFALGAFFLGEYILGLCELAVTAGLYALLQVRSLRRKNPGSWRRTERVRPAG